MLWIIHCISFLSGIRILRISYCSLILKIIDDSGQKANREVSCSSPHSKEGSYEFRLGFLGLYPDRLGKPPEMEMMETATACTKQTNKQKDDSNFIMMNIYWYILTGTGCPYSSTWKVLACWGGSVCEWIESASVSISQVLQVIWVVWNTGYVAGSSLQMVKNVAVLKSEELDVFIPIKDQIN